MPSVKSGIWTEFFVLFKSGCLFFFTPGYDAVQFSDSCSCIIVMGGGSKG
jgi:hypothetical protein